MTELDDLSELAAVARHTRPRRPTRRRPHAEWGFGLTLMLVVGTLAVASGTIWLVRRASSSLETAAEKPAASVDAADLRDEYRANEIAADSRYRGKLIEISGGVDRIRRDELGRGLLSLQSTDTAADNATGHAAEPGQVMCYFTEDTEASASGVRPGDDVSIWGRCEGKSAGAVAVTGSVVVRIKHAAPSVSNRSGAKGTQSIPTSPPPASGTTVIPALPTPETVQPQVVRPKASQATAARRHSPNIFDAQ